MALGQTLKALRQKQGLNQKSLSTLSGVSQATISRVETGRVRQLRSAALKNLADALGVSVDFLMGDSEVFADIPVQSSADTPPGVREDRFRQISDSLQPFALHEGSRIVYANQTLADILGYRREELQGSAVIDTIVAPQSRPLILRMLNSASAEAYQVLLVRRDGTSCPVEIISREVSDTVRLSLIRDNMSTRIQQAAHRIHQVGLQVDALADTARLLRAIGDELDDLGVRFARLGLNLIDEDDGTLRSFTSFSLGRQGEFDQESVPADLALEAHSPLRAVINHWRRQSIWEREAGSESVRPLHQDTALLGAEPEVLVDVPFRQGTLSVWLLADQPIRNHDLMTLMQAMSQPLEAVFKRLMQVDALLLQLRNAHEQLQGQSEDEDRLDDSMGLVTDADALNLGRDYRALSAADRDLVRSFVRQLSTKQAVN